MISQIGEQQGSNSAPKSVQVNVEQDVWYRRRSIWPSHNEQQQHGTHVARLQHEQDGTTNDFVNQRGCQRDCQGCKQCPLNQAMFVIRRKVEQ